MNKIISSKIVALTFGILVVCFAIAFYVIAWQEPTSAPPGGNVPTPLNVGPTGQSKSGGLILNTGGAFTGLIVEKGQTILKKLATPFTFGSSGRPATPETGQFYFDQNDKKFYYYDGTMWMRIEAVPSGTGKPCTLPSQCESGFCVDGYCCDSACNTTCYSCNVPGREGRCTMLTNMAEDGGCSQSCKGCYNGACVNWSSGEKDPVGANTCTNTHYRCDGAGSCTAPKSISGLIRCTPGELGRAFSTCCINRGYDGCDRACDWYCLWWQNDTATAAVCNKVCDSGRTEDDTWYAYYYCFNWVYD